MNHRSGELRSNTAHRPPLRKLDAALAVVARYRFSELGELRSGFMLESNGEFHLAMSSVREFSD
ncbi:MAG: hypothetical protein DMF44_04310 [Verrucomicrobia bacterium]|nr:MAG: hypothetical protein DMF05_09020 [Verrucomicrobiota bacterium]PYL24696.1 MAG: hypothetical protein DMF44_04310 [Verrucomicrobiota bacterium]PYL48796.1 MAG: hypothetical protein DMF32_08555 [Verrucomicrobiota bacterium]